LSLVELLVASVSASVLALTVGTLLVHGYVCMERNHVAVEVQRDGTFAMDMIGRAVRGAAAADVAVSSGRLTAAERSFYASGSDLLYDPDTAVTSNEIVLVDGRVVAFLPVRLSNGVRVDLDLRDGEAGAKVSGTFGFRR
jgi:hypothetical protein